MNPKQLIGIILPILLMISFIIGSREIHSFSQTVLGKLILLCMVLFYAEINITYGFIALVFVVFYYKLSALIRWKWIDKTENQRTSRYY
jgi:hypothetical protein